MQLQEAIQARLASDFNIFDLEGKRVDPEIARSEYAKIKTHLWEKRPRYAAIKLEKDYQYLLSMLACMELGITYIPMKHDYPEDRVQQINDDAPFEVLIDSELYKEIQSSAPEDVPQVEVQESDTLYVLFTSGSTGKPKGVEISRSAAQNYFSWLIKEIQPTNNDRFLQVTEFTFDISLIDVAMFIYGNVHLYFSQFSGNIFRLAFEVEAYEINLLSTVPNNLNMLLNDMVVERANFGSLMKLMIGGARFSWGLYEKCQKRLSDRDIYNFYGPTECTIYTHSKKLSFVAEEDGKDHNVSIGSPISNVEAIIKEGELLLGGAQLMKGYINNPDKTQESLIEINGSTYYKTGDLAKTGSNGEHYIVGRKDDTIKVRGYRVDLLDIDSYITRLPWAQDSACVALPDEINENKIIGFVILNEDKTQKEMKEELSSILLPYQIPEKFVPLEVFPVNTSGKVCKKQLKEML